MANAKYGWALFLGAITLSSWLSMASAQDIEWADAMMAAQRALDESRYSDAEQFLRTAVKEAEKFGPGDRRLDASFAALATVLYNQSKYEEAERTYLQVVGILEKRLGPGHLRVSESLSGLALIYQLHGKYKEAEPLLDRSLAIRERVLGLEHPDVAT